MDAKYKESDGWVKCHSKSRPGVSYYFNKRNGQSVWCNGANATETSPTKNKTECRAVLPALKTPAQDRLKRLQGKLQKHKQNPKEKKNLPENGKRIATDNLPKVAQKRKATAPASSETAVTKPDSAATAPPVQSKRTKPTVEVDKEAKAAKPAVLPSTSKHTNGIVRKFKELQKNVTERSKKALDGASKALSAAASSASHKQSFKAKNAKPEKPILKTAAVENAVNELKTQKKEENTSENFKDVSPTKVRKLLIPSYQKGSANSRLEKLRQSLNRQTFTEESFQGSIVPEEKQHKCDDVQEPMDWEAIDEDAEANSAMETPKKPAPNISEFYDNVNENLLRLSADKDKSNVKGKKKWHADYYYFVLDTNVLLQYLTFVDELSKMKLCDTKGTMLYIPYVTLQELDGLKMRKTDESVKTRAIRAIKYLNVHLHSGNMKAQSAIDERKHLIHISTADDSIINCCLQVKEHVENVILLSEDANLRNKALSNDILVSTKSDLISIHATSL